MGNLGGFSHLLFFLDILLIKLVRLFVQIAKIALLQYDVGPHFRTALVWVYLNPIYCEKAKTIATSQFGFCALCSILVITSKR